MHLTATDKIPNNIYNVYTEFIDFWIFVAAIK